MSDSAQAFVAFLIVICGTSTLCALLLIGWSAMCDRRWPDRDDALMLTKISFGIGGFGILMYFVFKYL